MTPLTLQSLPPVAARLCLEVERFCRGVLALPRGVSLVLGLSGGIPRPWPWCCTPWPPDWTCVCTA